MIVNIIKFIVGTGITSVLPVLFIEYCKRKKYIIDNSFIHRNFLCYATIMVSIAIGIIFENSEYIVGILLGSCLLHVMLVSGVGKMMSVRRKDSVIGYHGYFCAFSIVILLFLAADYLLSGVQIHWEDSRFSQNILSRFDGIILMCVFLIYLSFIYKNYTKDDNTDEIPIAKTGIIYGIILIMIGFGSLLIMNSVVELGVFINMSQYKVAMVFGAWGIGLSYILEARMENKKEIISEESYVQTIVVTTILIGITAIIHPILLGNYEIKDIILLSVFIIALQFLKNIDNRIMGSMMTTAYIVSVIYILNR